MDDEASIGDVIRALRKARGWTRQELADASTEAPHGQSVKAKALGKIEKGEKKPRVAALASVAHAFGIEDPELTAMGEEMFRQTAGGSARQQLQAMAMANSGIAAGGALGLAPGVGVVDSAAAMGPLERLNRDYRAALERRLRALAAELPASGTSDPAAPAAP